MFCTRYLLAAAVFAVSSFTLCTAEAGSIAIGPFGTDTLTATSAAGAASSPFTLGYFGNAGTNGLDLRRTASNHHCEAVTAVASQDRQRSPCRRWIATPQ